MLNSAGRLHVPYVLIFVLTVNALRDCSEHYNAGSKVDGVYEIQPTGAAAPFKVYCEMDTGAWTRIQRREDGHIDFYRTYADYQAGFGILTEEYWLGNDQIHALTKQSQYKLHIDFTLDNGTELYAEYSYFSIGSQSDRYRLNIAGFTGTALNNALNYHNGHQFYTHDNDNSGSCATKHYGGWWYNDCHHCNLNGEYRYKRTCSVGSTAYSCITWNGLLGGSVQFSPIRKVTMKVKEWNSTMVPVEQMNEPDLVITLDGDILSDENMTVTADCNEVYAASLKSKALIMTDLVNELIGSELCAGIPAANISHVNTVIATSGHQGTANITFKQPGNELLTGASQKQCVNAIGLFLQDHAHWLRPLIDVIPTCPVVYFSSEMFNFKLSRNCIE